jgi:hypothetical protein
LADLKKVEKIIFLEMVLLGLPMGPISEKLIFLTFFKWTNLVSPSKNRYISHDSTKKIIKYVTNMNENNLVI